MLSSYQACFCLITLLLFSACGQRAEDPSGVPVMAFEVNEALLGEAVRLDAHGLVFSPPRGWKGASADLLEEINTTVFEKEASVRQESIKVFYDADAGSFLSVTLVQVDGGGSFEEQTEQFANLLSSQQTSVSYRKAAFNKDGLHLVQFMGQSQGMINFKLLLASGGGDLLQFDYVVPMAHYPEQVKAVESSIGSLQRR